MENQRQESTPTVALEATTPRPGGILEALLAIAAEVPFVGKTDENEQQHYKFRSIDAVMAALKPLLVKHKVLVYPVNILAEEAGKGPKDNGFRIRQRIVYRFEHIDGSYRDVVVTGEGVDYGDKSCNKAMTVSLKYVCGQVFFIPYCEWADPDNESPESGPPVQPGPPAQRSSQPASQAGKPAQKAAPKVAPASNEATPSPITINSLIGRLSANGITGKGAVMDWMSKNTGRALKSGEKLKTAEIQKLLDLANKIQPTTKAA